MKRIILASTIAALALGGCYKANIHLADGPGTPGSVNNQLHFNLIGIIEISPAIDLKAACGGGQATTIHDEVSVLGGVINIILGNFVPILSVVTPTVDCGGAAAAPTGPAPEAPAPEAPPAS